MRRMGDLSRAASIGSLSGNRTTTGIGNTGIGVSALEKIIDGRTNTAVGFFAGGYTEANDGVFLGCRTKALIAGGVNEVVVGANAIGHGSNTATLGNTSVTATYLRGAINIGEAASIAAAPTASAHKGAYFNITGAADGYAPCWSNGTDWINLLTGAPIA